MRPEAWPWASGTGPAEERGPPCTAGGRRPQVGWPWSQGCAVGTHTRAHARKRAFCNARVGSYSGRSQSAL
eukprot:8478449-Alexandrium_andersonii.AAC.1